MTSTGSETQTFLASFTGRAMLPGQPDYDRSRAIWNGVIDRKPAVIARCTTAAQVADAIRFARAQRPRDRGPRRRSQLRRACGLRRRPDDPPRRDEQRHRRSRPRGARCAAAARPGPTSTRRRSSTGWRRPAASSATPASRDSRSAAASAGSPSRPGSRATTSSPPRWSPPTRASSARRGTRTPICSGRCAAAAATSASSRRSSSRSTRWARWSTSGLFFFGLENGAEALRFARDYVKTLPVGRHRLSRRSA